MKKENRRTFLRQIGLAVGALSIGGGEAPALVFQKKTGIRRTPPPAGDVPVDGRFAPSEWASPTRPAGVAGQAFVSGSGSLVRPPGSPDAGSVEVYLDGAGPAGQVSQRCEEPHIPFVVTSLSYGEVDVEMTAFSSVHEDEGQVDNVRLTIDPAGSSPVLRLVLKAGAPLKAEVEDEDDLPNGALCKVTLRDGDRRPFLLLDARPTITEAPDGLVLMIPVTAGGVRTFTLRMPAGDADEGDVADGITRIEDRSAAERQRWEGWAAKRGPVGWELPGAYGEFSVAAARIIDQMTPAGGGRRESLAAAVPAQTRPDVIDEHFISEAEFYLGREKEAMLRLDRVWSLQDSNGLLIGAGGPANTKEMCAAVYSLCRHAELTGDWAKFNEYYPDAFNMLDWLRQERDRAAGLPDPTTNARRNLLPEGSPGRGWNGIYEELTNTLWMLIALRNMLEISDRLFLPKKSELRVLLRDVSIALTTATKETMREDPKGFSWFTIVGAMGGGEGPAPSQQAGLADLSLALYPGRTFHRDRWEVKQFPSVVKASIVNDIPSGTGPGGAGVGVPVDAAVIAQTLMWSGLPVEARSIFIGFLNHASSVYTWGPAAGRGGSDADPRPDLRATAESVRFLRHAMVLEDEEVLRLFDGITPPDLEPAEPLRIGNSPTRWGRVSVSLEPVDRQTWKVKYRREPVNPEKAPPLKSIEMPRVLGPGFRFDTISAGNAVKNGPRVLIDPEPLEWEVFMRDPRR